MRLVIADEKGACVAEIRDANRIDRMSVGSAWRIATFDFDMISQTVKIHPKTNVSYIPLVTAFSVSFATIF